MHTALNVYNAKPLRTKVGLLQKYSICLKKMLCTYVEIGDSNEYVPRLFFFRFAALQAIYILYALYFY